MEPRTCPKCQKKIPHDSGFSFDSSLNLICDSCGGIAFSGPEAAVNENVKNLINDGRKKQCEFPK